MSTRVAVISANLGGYDPVAPWPNQMVPSDVSVEVLRFTDESLLPRPLAMTSRLQCGIPKWFGKDFAPHADVIIWIDASCAPTLVAVPWFLKKLGSAQIAVFRHPDRRTLQQEYDFIRQRMARPGETYLNSRYRGEDFDGLWKRLKGCEDWPLYASTAFVYRANRNVQAVLNQVLLWKVRHTLHDQFAFPWMLHLHDLDVNVIDESYLRCDALTFTRKLRPRCP